MNFLQKLHLGHAGKSKPPVSKWEETRRKLIEAACENTPEGEALRTELTCFNRRIMAPDGKNYEDLDFKDIETCKKHLLNISPYTGSPHLPEIMSVKDPSEEIYTQLVAEFFHTQQRRLEKARAKEQRNPLNTIFKTDPNNHGLTH